MDTPAFPVTIPYPPRRTLTLGASLTWALTIVAMALGTTMLVPAVLGMQRYVVTGGSMTGTYDRGSIVFDRVVPTAQLRAGDVITYRPPPSSGLTGLITHRIHAIRQSHGVRTFRTKGDANATPDPWTFTLPASRQARVAFSVP